MSNAIDTIVSKEAIAGLTALETKLKDSVAQIVKLSAEARTASSALSGINTPTGVNNNSVSNANTVTQINAQATAVQKLNKLTIEQKVSTQAVNLEQKRQETSVNTLVGAYANLSAKQALASKNYQDLIVRGKLATQTQKQYNYELKDAENKFNGLNARVLQADKAVGRFNRNVGNYPKQAIQGIGNLARAFGLVGGVMLFASVIKSAFATVKDFDKASADLAATLGKNRREITALTDNAKQLGAVTKFTATEIVGLQKELGKLGFSEQEILNSTDGISQLAAAVDTDLSTAAMVAGQTLRAFNLDASEMQRVVDVMAKSFVNSALDVSDFTESMKYVAPVAAASNITIEQTTALLGVLADNGIKGSMAGTSLRRIMTDLTKTGKPFNEALKELSKNGITVADAMDEVGRNAQTSLVVLGKNIPKVEALGIALNDAGGAAQKMADEQLKSLDGQLTLLTSAYDGFILSALEGESSLSNFLQIPIKNVSFFLTLLSNAFTSSDKLRKSYLEGEKTKGYKSAANVLAQYTDADEKKAYAEQALINTRKEIARNTAEFNKLTKENASIEENKKNKNLKNGQQEANKTRIKELNNLIYKQVGYVEGLKNSLKIEKEGVKLTNDQTKETKKSTDARKESTKVKKEEVKIDSDSLKALEIQISKLKQIQSGTSFGTSKYEAVGAQLKLLEVIYEGLTNTVQENNDAIEEGISIDDFEDYTDKRLKELEAATDEYISTVSNSFLGDAGLGSLQIFFDGTFSKLMQGADSLQEKFAVTFLAISEVAKEAFAFISQASQANFDAEYGRLEKQKDIALKFAGDGEAAKIAITEQYDERKKAIQKREAETQKKMALFNAGINIAQGITSALATANIPLAIIIGVIGAIQLATIASQQIPEFFAGGEHDGGLMLVNDGKGANYKETIVTPDGKIIKPQDRNTIMNAPKGTQIYTHDQWLNSSMIQSQSKGLTRDEFNSGIDKIVSSNNRESGGFSFDERGVNKWKSNNGLRQRVLNNRLEVRSN